MFESRNYNVLEHVMNPTYVHIPSMFAYVSLLRLMKGHSLSPTYFRLKKEVDDGWMVYVGGDDTCCKVLSCVCW